MSKLTDKQIAIVTALFKQHPSEKQVFVKAENGHMYFKKESALLSVGNDVKKLIGVSRDGKTFEVEADKSEESTSTGAAPVVKPLTEMKYTELKAYAEEKGIALDPSDNSKEKALAKILAAEKPGE